MNWNLLVQMVKLGKKYRKTGKEDTGKISKAVDNDGNNDYW